MSDNDKTILEEFESAVILNTDTGQFSLAMCKFEDEDRMMSFEEMFLVAVLIKH